MRWGCAFSTHRAREPRRLSRARASARPIDKLTNAVSDPEKKAERKSNSSNSRPSPMARGQIIPLIHE